MIIREAAIEFMVLFCNFFSNFKYANKYRYIPKIMSAIIIPQSTTNAKRTDIIDHIAYILSIFFLKYSFNFTTLHTPYMF